jgi:hypothetical protein
MATKSFINRLRARLHAFRAAEDGNVLLTFALALVPIIGFVGAAVDYSRGNSAKAADLDKVIILLTDGDNTESWKNSNNTKVTSETAINVRTQLACDNIKADKVTNIKIYTVRVINGNSALLKACASNPSMYYDVQSASALNDVFAAIAQNLANLRVAKCTMPQQGSTAQKQKARLGRAFSILRLTVYLLTEAALPHDPSNGL